MWDHINLCVGTLIFLVSKTEEIIIIIDETKKELGGKDKDMLVLPHVLDVSLNFRPIHSFLPRNSQDTPFIGIDGRQS